MAKAPMVTRTIQTTKVNTLCLNIVEGKPFDREITLPRTYKDDAAILKMVKKVVDTDTIKAVAIKSAVVQETLYGMTEQKFIELAQVLPPRGTKVVDDED